MEHILTDTRQSLPIPHHRLLMPHNKTVTKVFQPDVQIFSRYSKSYRYAIHLCTAGIDTFK